MSLLQRSAGSLKGRSVTSITATRQCHQTLPALQESTHRLNFNRQMPKHYCIFPLHQQLHLGAHILYSYCTATSNQNIHSNNSHHSPTCIPSYNTARTRMAWATGLIVFWTARLECNGHCTAISETIARIYFPLHYSLDKPISTKGHSGTLSTLIHHCIL